MININNNNNGKRKWVQRALLTLLGFSLQLCKTDFPARPTASKRQPISQNETNRPFW